MSDEKRDIRAERFTAKEGDLTALKPQCKNCVFSVIDRGLSCTIYKTIPLDVRLNKVSCKDFKSTK